MKVDSVLVFGATGTCGSEVAAALRSRSPSAKVFAFVRDVGKAQTVLPPGVELLQGDLREASDVERAFAKSGARRVFLSSSNGADQVQMETNAIAAAEDVGTELLVKVWTILMPSTVQVVIECQYLSPCACMRRVWTRMGTRAAFHSNTLYGAFNCISCWSSA